MATHCRSHAKITKYVYESDSDINITESDSTSTSDINVKDYDWKPTRYNVPWSFKCQPYTGSARLDWMDCEANSLTKENMEENRNQYLRTGGLSVDDIKDVDKRRVPSQSTFDRWRKGILPEINTGIQCQLIHHAQQNNLGITLGNDGVSYEHHKNETYVMHIQQKNKEFIAYPLGQQ